MKDRNPTTPDLSEAEKRNLVECWKCSGVKKSKVCRACNDTGLVVSQLGLIAEAIIRTDVRI